MAFCSPSVLYLEVSLATCLGNALAHGAVAVLQRLDTTTRRFSGVYDLSAAAANRRNRYDAREAGIEIGVARRGPDLSVVAPGLCASGVFPLYP